MNGTLRYRTSTSTVHPIGADGYRDYSVPPVVTNTYAEGVVWSPGPNANTVWVLPYSGASMAEAVSVHAPTPSKPFWHVEDAPFGMPRLASIWRKTCMSYRTYRYEDRPLTLDEMLRFLPMRDSKAQDYRQAQHNAPQLPRKTWFAALGITDVAQLELSTEDVAA